MIRVYAAAAALLVGLSFWAGWEWRDRSADLAQSRQATKQARAETQAVETARSAEHQQSDTLAKTFGIEPGWAARAVVAVGNYGELFRRNLGARQRVEEGRLADIREADDSALDAHEGSLKGFAETW